MLFQVTEALKLFYNILICKDIMEFLASTAILTPTLRFGSLTIDLLCVSALSATSGSRKRFCKAKIAYFQLSLIIDENIFWFYVSMHKSNTMNLFQGSHQLGKQAENHVFS